ncbi:ATP-binding protein [Streptomyces sp. JJ66]|uniref:ATP-binding protein n=1 Tax=Streptomyces sp. JJ66 TaxID=2803843 RepID=UPI00214C2A10|nr:ATP-binding protein [Streptomyces sp. JJ66]
MSTALTAWSAEELGDEAELLVSELVANAAKHTDGTRISVSVSRQKASVWVGVRDSSGALPWRTRPKCEAESGYGLELLEACSLRWGVAWAPRGKWGLVRAGDGEVMAVERATGGRHRREHRDLVGAGLTGLWVLGYVATVLLLGTSITHQLNLDHPPPASALGAGFQSILGLVWEGRHRPSRRSKGRRHGIDIVRAHRRASSRKVNSS